MATSFVGGATGSAINGNDATIDLTSLSGGSDTEPSEDDLVVVIASGDDDDGLVVNTSGYNEIIKDSTATQYTGAVERKFMGASPDTEVEINGGRNAAFGVAGVALVYRGVDTTTPEDATAQSTTGSSSSPNSPSITTYTDGAWVLSLIATGTNSLLGNINSGPSGYSHQTDVIETGDALKYGAGGADKEVASAGGENPGSWSLSRSSPWAAFTVALRPGTTAVTGSISQTLPFLVQAGSGVISFPGSVTQNLPFIVQSASGEIQFVGTVDQVLPFLVQAGSLDVSTSIQQQLPFLTQQSLGELAYRVQQTLPFILQNALGAQALVGLSAQALPFISVSLSGDVKLIGSISQVVPFISQSMAGFQVICPTLVDKAGQEVSLSHKMGQSATYSDKQGQPLTLEDKSEKYC